MHIQYTVYTYISEWWFQLFYNFTLKNGEDEPILTHIFQRDWFNHQPDFYVKTTLPQVPWPFALGASAAACCACGNPCGFPTGGNPYGTAGGDQTFGGDSTSCRNQTWGKKLTEGCQICINQNGADGRCSSKWWQIFQIFFGNVHPDFWGKWSNLTSIFFKWVGSTTN